MSLLFFSTKTFIALLGPPKHYNSGLKLKSVLKVKEKKRLEVFVTTQSVIILMLLSIKKQHVKVQL